MDLRSKLAYMALGGVLVLAGHVLPGLVVGSATAQGGLQDAEFNEVTVRKLTVVDEVTDTVIVRIESSSRGGIVDVSRPDGTMAVRLRAAPGGGGVGIYQPDGTVAAAMIASSDSASGIVSVHQPDGMVVAAMIASPDGGIVRVSQPDGTRIAAISAESEGGFVGVYQPDGTTAASMIATPDGGGIGVLHPDGTVAASMEVLPDGGAVGVYQPDGTLAVGISAEQNGGFVGVSQPDGTTAVTMMALPDGGAVGVNQPDGMETAEMAARPTGGLVRVTDKYGEPEAGMGVDESGDGYVLPGLVVGSATAQGGLQDAEFNEVTVRKLVVVDDDGKVRVEARGDVGIVLRDSQEKLRLILTTIFDVPMLGMRDTEGNTRLSLSVKPQELAGPTFSLDDEEGNSLVFIAAPPSGGAIMINDRQGNIKAAMLVENESGDGSIGTWDSNGNRSN